jgi:hypothetical protein
MARKGWDELQARFLADHHETGIPPKDWCEREGLNFASAKLYIKIAGYKSANSQKKSPKKTANSQSSKKPEAQQPKRTTSQTILTAITPDEFGLSEQQGLFAEHIVQGKSRIDAYGLAGYVGQGNAAYVTASQLLRNPKIARYVHALRNERQKRYAVELDDLITQLTAIVNADPNALSQYRHLNTLSWASLGLLKVRCLLTQLKPKLRSPPVLVLSTYRVADCAGPGSTGNFAGSGY